MRETIQSNKNKAIIIKLINKIPIFTIHVHGIAIKSQKKQTPYKTRDTFLLLIVNNIVLLDNNNNGSISNDYKYYPT